MQPIQKLELQNFTKEGWRERVRPRWRRKGEFVLTN